jgi:HEAT repeats
LSDNLDPVRVEARAIQQRAIRALKSSKAPEHLAAIDELDRLVHAESSTAIPALIAALDDPDPTIRLATAAALDSIGSRVVKSRLREETIRPMIMALTRALH